MVNRVYTVVYSFPCRIFTLPPPDGERLGERESRAQGKELRRLDQEGSLPTGRSGKDGGCLKS